MKADEWVKFLASVGHPVQKPELEDEESEDGAPEHEAERKAEETPGEEAAEHKKRVAEPSGDLEDLKAFRRERAASPEGEAVQKYLGLHAESIVAKLLDEEDKCPNCGGGLTPLPSNPKYRYCNKGKCKDLPTVVPDEKETKKLADKGRKERYGKHGY